MKNVILKRVREEKYKGWNENYFMDWEGVVIGVGWECVELEWG